MTEGPGHGSPAPDQVLSINCLTYYWSSSIVAALAWATGDGYLIYILAIGNVAQFGGVAIYRSRVNAITTINCLVAVGVRYVNLIVASATIAAVDRIIALSGLHLISCTLSVDNVGSGGAEDPILPSVPSHVAGGVALGVRHLTLSSDFSDLAIWGFVTLGLAVMSYFGHRGKQRRRRAREHQPRVR